MLQEIETGMCGTNAENLTTITVCFEKMFLGIVLVCVRALKLEMLGTNLYLY